MLAPTHAEHVAEVRARAHLDVLDDVAEHLAALDDAVAPARSRLFSSRMMSADSLAMSTAVSTEMPTSAVLQRGAVVDAVAQEADDVAARWQRRDDRRLLRRRKLGEHRWRLDELGELRVAQRLDVAAENDALDRQPDLAADLAGDDLVVAGENLDLDAVRGQRRDRRAGALLGRIEKGDVARAASGRTRRRAVGLLGVGELLVGDGDHAEAVGVESRAHRVARLSRWRRIERSRARPPSA